MEIKYVNPNESTDSLSSELFGAENSHTFKQRHLKEKQGFGRDSEMTPEEGRYPSPITWHCASPPAAMLTFGLLAGTMGSVGNVRQAPLS